MALRVAAFCVYLRDEDADLYNLVRFDISKHRLESLAAALVRSKVRKNTPDTVILQCYTVGSVTVQVSNRVEGDLLNGTGTLSCGKHLPDTFLYESRISNLQPFVLKVSNGYFIQRVT